MSVANLLIARVRVLFAHRGPQHIGEILRFQIPDPAPLVRQATPRVRDATGIKTFHGYASFKRTVKISRHRAVTIQRPTRHRVRPTHTAEQMERLTTRGARLTQRGLTLLLGGYSPGWLWPGRRRA